MVLGMITRLPFNVSPSLTASSLWNDQYGLSWFGSSFTHLGHPCMMTSLSHRTWSFGVVIADVIQASLGDLDDVELHVGLDVAFVSTRAM